MNQEWLGAKGKVCVCDIQLWIWQTGHVLGLSDFGQFLPFISEWPFLLLWEACPMCAFQFNVLPDKTKQVNFPFVSLPPPLADNHTI